MLKKYWEHGFNVIPVTGKRPIPLEWSKWATEKQSESLIDEWERLYPMPKYGVGLVCGERSGICAIDIDVDINSVKNSCPLSPVVRGGRPGREMRFFRYNPEIVNRKLSRMVEIFTNGGQVILPPSIHPDLHAPYKWLTPDTLENFDKADLPELTLGDVADIEAFLLSLDGKTAPSAGGRNNYLTSVVCAALSDHSDKSDEELAVQLMNIDASQHGDKAYFSDRREPECFKAKGNALNAALIFVQRHRKQLLRKGVIAKVAPPAVEIEIPAPKGLTPFPASGGLIGDIQRMILGASRSKQVELSTGGAIAICSALASNRFHIGGVPQITHQYIMNVARSGQGKGSGFHIASKLFGPGSLERHNMLGLRNYSSIASFVTRLPEQRTRLDMIDEFGVTLQAFAAGSEFKKDLEGLLCELWANRGDFWGGHVTKTDGAQGACYSPSVTVYANIQNRTLVRCATESMIESGFLGRFLFFSADDAAEFNDDYLNPLSAEKLATECARIFPYLPPSAGSAIITSPGHMKPQRTYIQCSREVFDYRKSIDRFLYAQEQEFNAKENHLSATFHSRKLQIAERLAITNMACYDRRTLTHDDYNYGLAVVEACMERAKHYLQDISGSTPFEKKKQWILSQLEKKGSVKHSVLLKNSHLASEVFKKLITTLKQSDMIVEFVEAANGPLHYRLVQP